MFKLIRDNVPAKAEAEGKVVNYATIQNKELYYQLLVAKFIEDSNRFLEINTAANLADLKLVIDSLVDYYKENLTDDENTFDKIYNDKIESEGKFDNKYVGFFADPTPEKSDAETKKEGE